MKAGWGARGWFGHGARLAQAHLVALAWSIAAMRVPQPAPSGHPVLYALSSKALSSFDSVPEFADRALVCLVRATRRLDLLGGSRDRGGQDSPSLGGLRRSFRQTRSPS